MKEDQKSCHKKSMQIKGGHCVPKSVQKGIMFSNSSKFHLKLQIGSGFGQTQKANMAEKIFEVKKHENMRNENKIAVQRKHSHGISISHEFFYVGF